MLKKEDYDLLKVKPELTDEEKASIAEYEKAEAEKNKEHMIPKSRFDEVNNAKKDLEARLAAIEKAQKDSEEQRLIEANKYKELYEQAKAEAEGLKPKASIAEESEKVLQSVLESQINEIPEHFRTLVPEGLTTNQKLTWISLNKNVLMKEKGIDIGAGKQGGGSPDIASLTPEELAEAKKHGITAEEYAKFK
jgi:ribonucleoside-triphosphate reductase